MSRLVGLVEFVQFLGVETSGTQCIGQNTRLGKDRCRALTRLTSAVIKARWVSKYSFCESSKSRRSLLNPKLVFVCATRVVLCGQLSSQISHLLLRHANC